MKFISLILFLLPTLIAGECRLIWITSERATHYEVFRGIDKIATTKESQVVISIPDDQTSSIYVIAVNEYSKSTPSKTIHAMPWIPEISFKLEEWSRATVQYIEIPTALPPDKLFIRASFPTLNKK